MSLKVLKFILVCLLILLFLLGIAILNRHFDLVRFTWRTEDELKITHEVSMIFCDYTGIWVKRLHPLIRIVLVKRCTFI